MQKFVCREEHAEDKRIMPSDSVRNIQKSSIKACRKNMLHAKKVKLIWKFHTAIPTV